MQLRDIISQAEDGFNLMRSRERHEVELTFDTKDNAVRFLAWCYNRRIAVGSVQDPRTVTVLVDG